jgi:hypothetical protein
MCFVKGYVKVQMENLSTISKNLKLAISNQVLKLPRKNVDTKKD